MSVRVIAGVHSGRRLRTPPGLDTRPTTDRARSALFSMLGALEGARVLDCFAGSGALGIEAASRGAARVTFVERGRPALAALRANLADLGLADSTRVLAADWRAALREETARGARYDLVLADPPFELTAAVAPALGTALVALTRPGSRVVVEYPGSANDPPELGLLTLNERRDRRYGAVAFLVATVGPPS